MKFSIIYTFNFNQNTLTIHTDKEEKSRTVPLPKSIYSELKVQTEKTTALLQDDLDSGFNGILLPEMPIGSHRNAEKDPVCQWIFPALKVTYLPEKKEYRRYHLHETHVQKAIKQAVNKSTIIKRVSAYTFRHCFASHLLQAGYNIRTIQRLLGHSNVRTTMIYAHTIKSRTMKKTKSPLDI